MLHDKSLLSGAKPDSRFSRLFDLFEQGLPQETTTVNQTLSAKKAERLLDLAHRSLSDRPNRTRLAAEPCGNDEFFRRIRAAGRGFDMGDLGEPLL